MSKALLVLTSVALLGLSGCADMNAKQSSSESTPAKPAISAEAQAALSTAQADVKAAKAKNALWTTAENALKAAEAAAAKGDSAVVLKEAQVASSMAQKGIAQLNEPLLKVGD